MKKYYYFIGIGGSGMSSLAQMLCWAGNQVAGSDRSFDRGGNEIFFKKLQNQGVSIFPQAGESISGDIDFVVVSSAIEESNPEICRARQLGIPVVHRSELLSELFNARFGIGIAGTSGKSTVAGMVSCVLDWAGQDPDVVNGGIIKNYVSKNLAGNAKKGSTEIMVAEIDESDGSIVRFLPCMGIITNIAKDHKEIKELKSLFQTFASNSSEILLLNGDCGQLSSLKTERAVTFGIEKHNTFFAENIKTYKYKTEFTVQGMDFTVNLPGMHNVYNGLAAVVAGFLLGYTPESISRGLSSFQGIKRRLEMLGCRLGITVFDDFAHNPHKIAASLQALKDIGKRVFVVFQPHGYGPTRFMLKELAEVFNSMLGSSDCLLLLDIYDAGGTANRSVTSKDIIDRISGGPSVLYGESRVVAADLILARVKPGDVVAVMGARDDSLSDLAESILSRIS